MRVRRGWVWGWVVAILLSGCSSEQVRRVVERYGRPGNGVTVPLSQQEVAAGLKEALSLGARHASESLSKPDAYLKNSLLRIPFPPEAERVKGTLTDLGLGNLVERVVVSLNRAAEGAADKAAPIFLQAIREMTLPDALKILRGSRDEATQYLKAKTHKALTREFRGPVTKSLDAVDATRYWKEAMSAYNRIPLVEKVNPDLAGYVTERALDGLFVKVAEQEALIRRDPKARVTDLLRRVFGAR